MPNFNGITIVDVALPVATLDDCNGVALSETAGYPLNGESVAAATVPQTGKSMFKYISSK